MMRWSLVLTAAALLAGCASAPGPGREADERQMARACAERGGVLVPSGAFTGRAQQDFACRLHQASRIPQR